MLDRRVFLLLFIITCSALYGKGQSEKSQLEIAQELIEEKKYNEAIALLTNYMYENPETVFEVQPLLDEIRDTRNRTNEAMDELLYVLYEEGDLDKGYEIIKRIEEENPYPDELARLFLRDAREAATQFIYRNQFYSYMDIALEHLNRGEYIEAINNYLLCLDFHVDEFDLLLEYSIEDEGKSVNLDQLDGDVSIASYLSTLKNSSYREVDTIKDNSRRLQNYLELLRESYNRIDSLIGENQVDIESLRQELTIYRELPEYLDIYSDTLEQLEDYNNLFANINARGTSSRYISYATLTLNGRQNREEGFIDLSNMIYPAYLQNLIDKADNYSESLLLDGLNQIEAGDYEGAILTLTNGINSFNVLRELAATWGAFISIDDNFQVTNSQLIKDKFHYIEDSRVAIDLIESYIDIAGYYGELEEGIDREDLEVYRAQIELRLGEVNELTDKWLATRDDVNNRVEVKYVKSQDRINSILNSISSINRDFISREIDIVSRISRGDYITIFNRDVDEEEDEDAIAALISDLSKPTNQSEEINIYFGINSTDERELITYNPQRALDDLTALENEYNDFIQSLNNYLDKFENEKDYIFANVTFNNRYESVERALNLAQLNRVSIARNKEEANAKLILSRESQIRGYDLYEDAVIAFERERFSEAKDFIQTGREVSEVAISYSKNPLVIEDLIPAFYELEDRITKEEARIVIRDVRNLITSGKNQYLEGAYIQASNTFKQAELRWAETNIDAHPEIPYWIALIRAALEVESGRYLSITEPLYSVLAGYLSFAEKNYRTALNEDNKIDKINYLTVADSYIQKVIEVRPLNERARLLQLRVLKEKDPDAFATTFNNDFNQYRNTALRAIDNNPSLPSGSMLSTLAAYEEVVRDAYLRNPRLTNSLRRFNLERFYKPPAPGQAEDIEKGRENISQSYTRFKALEQIAEGDQKQVVTRIIALCEVALGFRRLPVDTSNIRNSNAIFTAAQNRLEVTDERDIEALNEILAELKRALTLNPDNDIIPVVIDEILVMLGEESNFQLAPAQDKLFREAQKDFIDGRYFAARTKIIDILTADSRNKNYPKLKELINRVEVKIKEEIIVE